jgi:hypothetical protein
VAQKTIIIFVILSAQDIYSLTKKFHRDQIGSSSKISSKSFKLSRSQLMTAAMAALLEKMSSAQALGKHKGGLVCVGTNDHHWHQFHEGVEAGADE